MTKAKTPDQTPDSFLEVGNIDEMVEQGTKIGLLPCKLTNDELLEIGQEIAQAQLACEKLQDEKKAAAKKFDGDIQRQKNIVSLQSRIFRSGKEDRDVEIAVIKNFRTGTIRETRTDTGEVLVERPMSPSERQRGLKL